MSTEVKDRPYTPAMLRDIAVNAPPLEGRALTKAADSIESLSSQVERMRETLEAVERQSLNCPFCLTIGAYDWEAKEYRAKAHTPDCKLSAALKQQTSS